MTDFDGSFGGWGVQPNPSPGGGLPNTEEQTGEEDISAVLYRDALFSDEYGSDVGPGGVSISQQAGISRAPKHGIVCLDSAEMGRAFCGGRVGTRATKMCIKADCTLKTHQVKARDLFLSPCMEFIQGPQGGKNLPPTTVFSSPAVLSLDTYPTMTSLPFQVVIPPWSFCASTMTAQGNCVQMTTLSWHETLHSYWTTDIL